MAAVPKETREPAIGLLGGMGPMATVELMRRVVAATPARDDADHIRMIVDNNPKVPSRIAALIEGTGADPAPVLAAMARGLAIAGADVLAIPCMTAHAYLPAIRAAVAVPVIDMIEVAGAELARLEPRPRASACWPLPRCGGSAWLSGALPRSIWCRFSRTQRPRP